MNGGTHVLEEKKKKKKKEPEKQKLVHIEDKLNPM